MTERETDAAEPATEPVEHAATADDALPMGSRLWQLLATRTPDALHAGTDAD